MSGLAVEIVDTNGTAWQGIGTCVQVPGLEGAFTVLPGHQPLATLMRRGTIHVDAEDGTHSDVPVEGGFVFVDADHVTILLTAHPDAKDAQAR